MDMWTLTLGGSRGWPHLTTIWLAMLFLPPLRVTGAVETSGPLQVKLVRVFWTIFYNIHQRIRVPEGGGGHFNWMCCVAFDVLLFILDDHAIDGNPAAARVLFLTYCTCLVVSVSWQVRTTLEQTGRDPPPLPLSFHGAILLCVVVFAIQVRIFIFPSLRFQHNPLSASLYPHRVPE